jgi:nijmegen breakage syndrome protein 1
MAGGQLKNDWTDECTHLVMKTITVTIKVVAALACCKPIVTAVWLEEACRSVEQQCGLPDTIKCVLCLQVIYVFH